MKKILIMAVLVALVATPAMAMSIAGSKHDMIASGFALATGNTEICIFCHTPHSAQTTEPLVPLWNNTAVAAGGTIVTFYTSPTTNFTSSAALIDATDARLCLACHNSGVGMPVNGPNTGSIDGPGAAMSTDALLGINMTNDHPIGMDLAGNPESADPSIRTILEIKTSFGGVNPFFGDENGVPPVNIMYCSSCHDVHDNTNDPFLRKNNYGSNLCKACHKK